MKPIEWLGNSRKMIQQFPPGVRRQAGVELFAVQLGDNPSDWRPMPTVGAGVNEIRIHGDGEYRVVYVAKFPEAVYVLHAFSKKTRRTAVADVTLAAGRYRSLVTGRRTR